MGDIRTSQFGGIPFGNNANRPTASTGQPYFNGEEKRLELYTSTGWQNIVSETPGVVSVSGNYLESAGSGTLTITGTNFTTGAVASVIGTNGIEILATSTTVNSIVSASAAFTGLVSANEPYDLKITNTSNLFGLLPDAIYVNNILNWQTAAGSLGTFGEQVSISVSAIAIDDSTLSYTLASGSTLPSGITLNSSTGVISGTLPSIATNTTYTFTINASDGLNPAVPRAFSIASIAAPEWNTSAGSLGSVAFNGSANFAVSATSPAGSSLVYTLASGSSLPSALSLSSSGQITGTAPTVSTNTTYTFTVNVSDGINPVVPRTFSIVVNGPAISGGLLASDATYYYRVFKTNDNLVTNFSTSVDVLAVAGGGGGGAQAGGGAGGLIVSDAKSIIAGSYPIVAGTGGATGVAGLNTTCFGHTANGGGRGGGGNDTAGGSGGSGGGSGRDNGTGGSANQGSGAGFTGYGFNGGNSSFSGHGGAGGGGGAGAAGANGTGNGNQSAEGGGAGGAGHNGKSSWLSAIASIMPSDWQTATSSGRIAGGGGTTSNGGSSLGTSGAGGAGGGGRGFNPSVGGFYGDPGINHTGGGGGSSRQGGDGIVVIRYLRSAVGG